MEPQDFSNDRECIIESIKSMNDSQWGKRVNFRIAGYPHEVSTFTKWPEKMTLGAKIYGHIEIKDGKYHNFRFGKKETPSPTTAPNESRAGNLLEFEVIPILKQTILPNLDRILARQAMIMKALNLKVDETGYPQMNEKNDASGFDEAPPF